MASIPSFSGTQSTTTGGWQQFSLQQAKRNADQATRTAQALEAQAQNAQQTAASAQEYAQSLSSEASQAEVAAGRSQQGLAAIETANQMQVQLSNFADQIVGRQQVALPTTSTSPPPQTAQQSTPPVVNTQGQVTGQLISTSA